MPYTINKFSGAPLVVLEDGTLDTSTSIGLVGRNYVGYGETQNENFLYLLENFANAAPPSRPISGQTWFDTTTGLLNVYNGDRWAIVGSAILSEEAPVGPTSGALWLKESSNTLYVWNGATWEFVGPESAEGFGVTRARSTTLNDVDSNPYPVILFTVNDEIIAISSQQAFTIDPNNPILGFSTLAAGITLSTTKTVKGSLTGNADTATRLLSTRTINGISFNGTQDITIKSSTTQKLNSGDYIVGNDFDGAVDTTWNIDASSSNLAGKIVARNSFGGFSASTITADLLGNVTTTTGESSFNIVRATSFIGATLSGNADTASRLQTARTINGVSFNGTENVTVPVSGLDVTGNFLSLSVTQSNLQRLGTLELLDISGNLQLGPSPNLTVYPTKPGDFVGSSIRAKTSLHIELVNDEGFGTGGIVLEPPSVSVSNGGDSAFVIQPQTTTAPGGTQLGATANPFSKIFAEEFKGNADTATLATTATNIAGGGQGSIPYQTAAGTTSLLPIGTSGYVLKAGPSNSLGWEELSQERLTKGSYLNYVLTGVGSSLSYYDSQQPVTISVDATPDNTASKVVARDASGNFSAGTITASLAGNASSATTLQTARNINGVAFNGSADITIEATDPTKLPLAGGTVTGPITLPGSPTLANHATTKAYVDTRIPTYTFTYGNTVYSTSGYTNQVGSFNNGANYFDVFPPLGKTISDLEAFVPSIAVIYFAGGVNGDDRMRCTWSILSDRVRVYVQNTEQNGTPAANYLAIWR